MFLAICQLGYKDYYIRRSDFGRDWTWEDGTNPSGKTGVNFKYCNGTGKTIKYLVFTCIPYNQVNDVVSCNVTGEVEMRFKMTGPIEPSSYWQYAQFADGWDNPNISSVRLTKVDIQYMDGSTETLSERQLAEQLEENERSQRYNSAVQLMAEGSLAEAMEIFKDLGDFRESANNLEKCKRRSYNYAVQIVNNILKVEGRRKLADAIQIFQYLGDYRESASYLEKCKREYEVLKRESAKKWRSCFLKIVIILALFYSAFGLYSCIYMD